MWWKYQRTSKGLTPRSALFQGSRNLGSCMLNVCRPPNTQVIVCGQMVSRFVSFPSGSVCGTDVHSEVFVSLLKSLI